MRRVKSAAVLFLLLLCSAILQLYGIDALLPSEARTAQVFGTPEERDSWIEPMMASRQEQYEAYEHHFKDPAFADHPDPSKPIAEKTLATLLRASLLSSGINDDAQTLGLLSRLRPEKLEFDTTFYQYGGFYVYPLAAFLKALSLTGLISLEPDATYYLRHPEKVRDLYLAIKGWGIAFALFSGLIFYRLSRRFFEMPTSLMLSGLYLFSPTLILAAQFSKPYLFVLPLLLLSFLLALREKTLFLSAIFAGCTAGTLLPYGNIVLVNLSGFLLLGKRTLPPKKSSVRRGFSLVTGYLCIAAGTYALTNPFALLNASHFFKEMGPWGTENVPLVLSGSRFIANLSSFKHLIAMPALAASFIGAWMIARRFPKETLIGLSSFFPLFLPLMLLGKGQPHYALFFLPFLLLPIGISLQAKALTIRKGARILCVAAILLQTGTALFNKSLFAHLEQGRLHTGDFINHTAPAGSSIGLGQRARFITHPYFHFAKYQIHESLLEHPEITVKPDFLVLEGDPELFAPSFGQMIASDYLPIFKWESKKNGQGLLSFQDIYHNNYPILGFRRRLEPLSPAST